MSRWRAPFVLLILSRRRCGDMGTFFGTPRIVAHKVARKMARARKPAQATVRHVSGSNRVMDGRSSLVIHPENARAQAQVVVS